MLLFSYIDSGYVKHVKLDLNFNVISSYKSTDMFNNNIYSGENDGVTFITARDSSTLPVMKGRRIIYKKEIFDSLSCNYQAYMEVPVPGPIHDSSVSTTLLPQPLDLMLYSIDTLSYTNVIVSSVCSPIVTFNELSEGLFNVKIYPNPLTDNFTLEYSVPLNAAEITIGIYDVLGKHIKTVKKSANHDQGVFTVSINTKEMNSGIYILKVNNGHSSTEKKIVKL